jgi:hypothetical protein
MRHGLTMGELARWFIATLKLDVDCQVITMEGWAPDAAPGYGWPIDERSWINPSPNAPNLSMARAYAGTVMLEGTTLSEGRGTTRPLELFGAPDIDARKVIAEMQAFAPKWLAGCRLRECWFEPTFHKHAGKLCNGVQIHVEDPTHYNHAAFRPWRLQALAFKAIRRLQRNYLLWRDFPTNTSTTAWPSTSSTAPRSCASGWTTTPPAPATWTPWPWPTSGSGTKPGGPSCCTDRRRNEKGRPGGALVASAGGGISRRPSA